MAGEFITLLQANPKISITFFGLAIAFLISLVNHLVLDKERMRELKKRQKDIQEEMKKHKDNPEKTMALQKEMMSHAGESMKHSFKPLLITIIPIIIFFAFIKDIYSTTVIAKSWIWWYIGSSIVGSIIFRKVFDLP